MALLFDVFTLSTAGSVLIFVTRKLNAEEIAGKLKAKDFQGEHTHTSAALSMGQDKECVRLFTTTCGTLIIQTPKCRGNASNYPCISNIQLPKHVPTMHVCIEVLALSRRVAINIADTGLCVLCARCA